MSCLERHASGGKSYSVLGGKDEERGLLPRVVEGFLGEKAELFDGFWMFLDGFWMFSRVVDHEFHHEPAKALRPLHEIARGCHLQDPGPVL